ncbi:MAG: Na+/H+ antiporter NhaA [Planctomycetota bacterium]
MGEDRPPADVIDRWEDEGGAMAGSASGPSSGPRGAATRSPHQPADESGSAGGPKLKRPPDGDLPSEFADWLTKPFARFFKIEAAAAVMLLIATVAALVLSNSGWATRFAAFWETPVGLSFGDLEFSRSLRHWINDGFMTLFFFVVALELKREIVLGELRHVRTAALSFAGALGGMLVPACAFLALMRGQAGMNGWGTVTATDTAFAIGCLALLGSRIPPSLRLFILSLAIFDDIGAIFFVVAFGYGEAVHWAALAAAALGVLVLAGIARAGIRSIPVYFVLGIAIWLFFDASGIHPTLTGVAMGLMTPTRRWVSNLHMRAILGRVLSHPQDEHAGGDTIERRNLRKASKAARESSSPAERLEFMLHPWVGFVILPIFAFANAGVAFSGAELMQPLSIAILVAFVLGKPAGVLSVSWLAVRLGLAARPPGLTWPLIVGGGLLTGIGFTMALFIAGLAFTPQQFADAKIGILLSSVISALAGIAALFWLTSGRRKTHRDHLV